MKFYNENQIAQLFTLVSNVWDFGYRLCRYPKMIKI
jgi:hypothetical protein